VFVVEQNRDAQMRSLLVNELGVSPEQLVPVLHYDGTPITARFIARSIAEKVKGKVEPARTQVLPEPPQPIVTPMK